MDLPQYRSHKVVRALKIAAIEFDADGSARIAGSEQNAQAGPGYLAKYANAATAPSDVQDLGYYVVYADGYESWSPSKAFEEGYSPDTGKELAHKPLPVAGYTPQNDEAVAAVNANKQLEERVLRRIEEIGGALTPNISGRWLAIAKTHIEEGFMAMNRAVFQPKRVALPEDKVDANQG